MDIAKGAIERRVFLSFLSVGEWAGRLWSIGDNLVLTIDSTLILVITTTGSYEYYSVTVNALSGYWCCSFDEMLNYLLKMSQ